MSKRLPTVPMNPSIAKLWESNFKLLYKQLKTIFGKDFVISCENGFSQSQDSKFWINEKEGVRKPLPGKRRGRWVFISIDHFRANKTSLEMLVCLCCPGERHIIRRIQPKYLLTKRLQNAVMSFIENGDAKKLQSIVGTG